MRINRMHDWEPFKILCLKKEKNIMARHGSVFIGKVAVTLAKGERLILDKISKSGEKATYRTQREEMGYPFYVAYGYDAITSGVSFKPCSLQNSYNNAENKNENAYENVSQISSAGGRRKTRRRLKRRSRKN